MSKRYCHVILAPAINHRQRFERIYLGPVAIPKRGKRVQDRHEYRVRFSAVSLTVDADLEAMRNSAFGVERQLKRHEFKYVRAVPGTKDSL